jgi:hypothetical protein
MAQKNTLTVQEVPNVLRIARQKAALGLYKESVKSYKHALDILSAHIKEISEPCLKEQWKKTNEEVRDEVAGVYKLYKAMKEFNGKVEKKEQEVKPVPLNVIQHFGRMPFSKKEEEKEPKKDPMIWDPPSPPPKKSVKKASKQNQGRPPINQRNKPTTA